jgi:hypothetical protein
MRINECGIMDEITAGNVGDRSAEDLDDGLDGSDIQVA